MKSGKGKAVRTTKPLPSPTADAADPKRYCGIVFIGGGSSWCYAATVDEAATKAVRQAKGDWKHLFEFEPGCALGVVVVDMKDHSGWYANRPGEVRSLDTTQVIHPTAIKRIVL